MKLKIKFLKWSAGLPVAMLKEKTAAKIGVHARDRILMKSNSKQLITVLDTVKSGLVKENEIAVSSEIKDILKLKSGKRVEIKLAPSPKSLKFIKKKLNNKTLSQKEISVIIKDIVNNSLSEAEIALFVSGMYKFGMNMKETIFLTKAIFESGGNNLNLKRKLIADKHSIGGVAGNRTTPLIVSICAAAGLTMPKTSSRAITSAAGTADVMEAIAKIDFSMKQVKKIVKKTNACMVWGGSLNMVPADSRIIHIEKMLKIDPESQLLASIMAKKLSVGSKYILIDIPYGKTAKASKKKAKNLRKKFLKIAKHFHLNLKVVLTDGRQPIGRGIGPVLELIDVISILDPNKKGPIDLQEKSIYLAGKILEMTNKAKKSKGEEMARELLNSGKAFDKFKEIIKAQKGKTSFEKLKPAKFQRKIFVKKSGKIKEIDNRKLSTLARILGCPADKSSGILLSDNCRIQSKVKKGDLLFTIYSKTKSRLNEAVKFFNDSKAIIIK